MMSLDEMLAVLTAAKNGAKIEVRRFEWPNWEPKHQEAWYFHSHEYRIKPPAKKIVKSLAWRNSVNGDIIYRCENYPLFDVWQRFPCADFEGEVEE